jgi:hypothetical protein
VVVGTKHGRQRWEVGMPGSTVDKHFGGQNC